MPAPRAVHVGLKQEIFVLDNAGRVLVYDAEGTLLRQWWMPDYDVGKPEKICQFRDGRLVVADTHYHRVVIFDSQGNELARRGTLGREPGEFIYPVAVVEDDSENYYVCEYGSNDRVQKFDKQGTFLLQFGGFGTGQGEFQRPSGIVWLAGKVYVVDAFNSRIQVFSDQGEFLEILADGNRSAELNYPYDISANEKGELFVVEYTAGRVSKFNSAGKLLGRYGSSGLGRTIRKTVGDRRRPEFADLRRRHRKSPGCEVAILRNDGSRHDKMKPRMTRMAADNSDEITFPVRIPLELKRKGTLISTNQNTNADGQLKFRSSIRASFKNWVI